MWFRLCLIIYLGWHASAWANCVDHNLAVQVLGSGGPEVTDQRASSSYVIWHNNKARLLVDIGSGSLHNLEKTTANINDIDTILLTHLHVDHTADLPAFIKASFFTDRAKVLNILGPTGNQLMPATTDFVNILFGKQGAYRYLSSYLDGSDHFQIAPQNINPNDNQTITVVSQDDLTIRAVRSHHGQIPALAWQINIDGKKMVFSGDMNNANNTLTHLAKNADLLIAHHAIPETGQGVARALHMPPSTIGQIAMQAKVKQLVLSHHMERSNSKFTQAKNLIRNNYLGPLLFAKDFTCISL